MGTVPLRPIDIPMIEVAAHSGRARVASRGRNPVESPGDSDTRAANTTNTSSGTTAADAKISADSCSRSSDTANSSARTTATEA